MKILATAYTFNAAARTVTLNALTAISLEQVLLISNVTRGEIIYNFADPARGATVAGNVLTLEHDTSEHNDADRLQIFYDDGLVGIATAPKLLISSEGSFNRPANTTAYGVNDMIANSATSTEVVPVTLTFDEADESRLALSRLRVRTNDTGVGNAATQLRAFLFRATGAVNAASGDNKGFVVSRGDFLGCMSGFMRSFWDGSSGILVPEEGPLIIADPADGTKDFYLLLQSVSAWTPTSVSSLFSFILEAFQGR